MIGSFKHSGLKKLFIQNDPTGVSAKDESRIRRILNILQHAGSLKEMRFVGSGLHQLEPKSGGRWAMKVDKRFRITFVWHEDTGEAHNVNLENYH